MPSSVHASFAPLLAAVKQVQFWLEFQRPPQVMVAGQTLEEFESQKLPSHCEVARRKIYGPRVPVRGRKQLRKSRSVLAYWPEDALVEGILSTLIVVLDGEANPRVADYEVRCRPGDMLFIPARTPKLDGTRPPHEKIIQDRDCDLLMIFHNTLSTSDLSLRICRSHNDQHAPASVEEACWVKNHFLVQLFTNLGDRLQNKAQSRSTFYLLASLVSLLQEEIESGRGFSSLVFPSDSSLSIHQDPIQHALQYMQNHLDKPLSIDLLARWVGLSRTVFTERFRAQTGESFKSTLTRLRLERTEVLLNQSNLPVEEISGRIGLTSGQLRNLFRKTHQCTPTEFRRSQKSGHN